MSYAIADLIRLAKDDFYRRNFGRVPRYCRTPNWVRERLHRELRHLGELIGMTVAPDAELTHVHGLELWTDDRLEYTDIVCVVEELEPR